MVRFIFLYLLSIPSFAQLTELKPADKEWQLYGQVKYVGSEKASLQYIPRATDTSFLLLMYDQRPELKQYFSIAFSSRGGSLGELYAILMSFFEKSRKKEGARIFQLGNEKVSVYRSLTIGTKAIILKTDKGRIELREGEIKKLFNKK